MTTRLMSSYPPFPWGEGFRDSFVASVDPPSHKRALVHVFRDTSYLLMTLPSPQWQIETESLTAEIDQLLSALQLQGVRLGQQREIYSYFLRFPDMIDAVEQAVFLARSRLKEAQLELEVYCDPLSDDEHLVLYARFPEYDETVMEKIRNVRKEYRHLLQGKAGWFILTTDFQQPK